MSEPELRGSLNALFFYLTRRCNQRCIHCWVEAGPDEQAADLLSVDEYDSVLEQGLSLGLKNVKVTGGEPLLRPAEAVHILRRARSQDLRTTLETNGVLLSGRTLDGIAESGVSEVAISLDSCDPEAYARIRGSGHHFPVVVRNAVAAATLGLTTVALITVFPFTLDSIVDTCHFALEKLGAKLVKISPCTHMGRASDPTTGLHLSSAELLQTAETVRELARAHPGQIGTILPWVLVDPAAHSGLAHARCEFTALMGVMPDGGVSICGVALNSPEALLANVRQTPLASIWSNSATLVSLRQATSRDFGGLCSRCIFASQCANLCPAMSYAAYGSFLGPCPICEQIHSDGLFPVEYLAS